MKHAAFTANIGHKGIVIGLLIIVLWWLNLAVAMQIQLDFANPLIYVIFLLQTHLYTGLFITAHDAMHGTVAPGRKSLNDNIGRLATFFYAFFPYQKLHTEHHKHHDHVHTEADPDYYESHFWGWYLRFVLHYVTFWQILGFAIIFNLLKLILPTENLIFFWLIPSVLSTLQLFYFGTYRPHRGTHDNPLHSRSQAQNHLWAFVSCYFFGYHHEHHDTPYVPWWLLWKAKELAQNSPTN